MEHGKRSSPCVWTAITRTLYHAARSSSTAVCPASISGIKISAYFSIISARKPAKALHSSELDVQAETGKRSFSLAGYFFNRQLHFLVAEQRVPAILSNFLSNLTNQFFQPFQLFLCVLLPEADPNAGNRNAHLQQAVVDAGVSSILWVPDLVQRQIGGNNEGLPAAVYTNAIFALQNVCWDSPKPFVYCIRRMQAEVPKNCQNRQISTERFG